MISFGADNLFLLNLDLDFVLVLVGLIVPSVGSFFLIESCEEYSHLCGDNDDEKQSTIKVLLAAPKPV